MTRLGRIVLLVLVLAGIGFAAMVRFGGRTGVASPAASTGPASAPLVVPVQGVARSALVDDWGDPRGGGTRPHHALDIPAPAGTPVLAAADGRIEKLFTSARGGLTVYERSADGGTVYYYAHLARYAPQLTEGQAIRAGRQIGAVGSTGDADEAAPHLHFEVHRMAPGQHWWEGEGVDPYPLLRQAG